MAHSEFSICSQLPPETGEQRSNSKTQLRLPKMRWTKAEDIGRERLSMFPFVKKHLTDGGFPNSIRLF